MVVNYQNAKIYVIRSPNTEKVYVGSTCQKLCNRMANHMSSYRAYNKGSAKYTRSFEIIKLGGAYIELLEKCPCSCKEELHKTEGVYIRKHDCVNQRIAGRTQKEWRKDNKEWAAWHKEYTKQWAADNKDKVAASNKTYYDKNTKAILANQSKRVVCHVCGIWIAKSSKAKHVKRKNHLFNMGICQQIDDLTKETARKIKELDQQKKRRNTDAVVEMMGGEVE